MENQTDNQIQPKNQAGSTLLDPTNKQYQSTQKVFTEKQILSHENEFLIDISKQNNASNDVDSIDDTDMNDYTADDIADITESDSSWGDSADLVDGSTLVPDNNEDEVVSHLDNGTEITRGGLGSASDIGRDLDQDEDAPEDIETDVVKPNNIQRNTAI